MKLITALGATTLTFSLAAPAAAQLFRPLDIDLRTGEALSPSGPLSPAPVLAEPISFGYDPDGDGHTGLADNCPQDNNRSQADIDVDGLGDVCDPRPANICEGGPDFLVMSVDSVQPEDMYAFPTDPNYVRAILAVVHRQESSVRDSMARLYDQNPKADELQLMLEVMAWAKMVRSDDYYAFQMRTKELKSGEVHPLDPYAARILADYCTLSEIGLEPAVELP
jgi:hypothetical protein